MARWYLGRNDEVHGPFTDDEMTMFARIGTLNPLDYVRTEESEDWFPANNVAWLRFGTADPNEVLRKKDSHPVRPVSESALETEVDVSSPVEGEETSSSNKAAVGGGDGQVYRFGETSTRELRERVALVVLSVVLVALAAGGARRLLYGFRDTTIPERMPVATELTAEGMGTAKQAYLSSLKSEKELVAFYEGYKMQQAKLELSGGKGDINLGESHFTEEQQMTARETEAYAMGIHFAHQESLLQSKDKTGRPE